MGLFHITTEKDPKSCIETALKNLKLMKSYKDREQKLDYLYSFIEVDLELALEYLGVWCNGNTLDSKSETESSILSLPAKEN